MARGQAKRITDEIFQVGGSGLTAPEDAAIYLIHVDGRAALVDAGCGGGTERLLANVAAAGVAPERIEFLLITHCHFDHTGGAAGLRERTGCRVVTHDLEADYLERGDNRVSAANWYSSRLTPCPVDRRLSGAGGEIRLGERPIAAMHIPGHSPGSVAYLCDSGSEKVLFGQDVHGPLHPDLRSDARAYQDSLKRLLATECDILCEGHYGVFRGAGPIAAFIRSFMEDG